MQKRYQDDENTPYVARIYDNTGEIHLFKAERYDDGRIYFSEAAVCNKVMSKHKFTDYNTRSCDVLEKRYMRIACALYEDSENICGVCMSHFYKTGEPDDDTDKKQPEKGDTSRCMEICDDVIRKHNFVDKYRGH